ncbi:hypothetical protein CDL12_06425 [Handroanthus impetiginosus]|uniref:Pollen allergen Ole e 1 family n=1 Tax=Handroanthus impetiginosus TaxID=429701 RepID=A0A2G9HTL6_9LAMI|nr:hypothetical protein CDL12_06424 [Handroanthus impetiginosus]PIN20869.1 hypothetical protein CDL12_06425 [Handroanthus impetiginosus]
MAKAVALVSALCILAMASITHSHKVFKVEGEVYCDPCRVQFKTELSEKLPGATVKLECNNIDTKAVTYSVEAATDSNGRYSLQVEGDHENDICQVKAIKSPKADCSELMSDIVESKIECTENSGIHTDVRYANPIGFMTKESLPQCLSVLQDVLSDD